MAVCSTLMARATTVGPGGRARTAWRSSSSHWRTTLSLADGGYWSKVYSGGGSVRSSGAGGGGGGGPAVGPEAGPAIDRVRARTANRTSGSLFFMGPPTSVGVRPRDRGDAASRAGAGGNVIRN